MQKSHRGYSRNTTADGAMQVLVQAGYRIKWVPGYPEVMAPKARPGGMLRRRISFDTAVRALLKAGYEVDLSTGRPQITAPEKRLPGPLFQFLIRHGFRDPGTVVLNLDRIRKEALEYRSHRRWRRIANDWPEPYRRAWRLASNAYLEGAVGFVDWLDYLTISDIADELAYMDLIDSVARTSADEMFAHGVDPTKAHEQRPSSTDNAASTEAPRAAGNAGEEP